MKVDDAERRAIRDNVADMILKDLLPVVIDDIDMRTLRETAQRCAEKVMSYLYVE